MNKKEDFVILIENLLFSYRQFCLNRIMHEKVETKLYEDFQATWNSLLLSLEEGYLLGLHKFFEKPNSRHETISIYKFLDQDFANHSPVIGKIKKIRDQMIAHLDPKAMRKEEGFLKELDLKRDDIKPLFEVAISALERLKSNFGLTEDFNQRFKQEKTDSEREFTEWFTVFRQLATKTV